MLDHERGVVMAKDCAAPSNSSKSSGAPLSPDVRLHLGADWHGIFGKHCRALLEIVGASNQAAVDLDLQDALGGFHRLMIGQGNGDGFTMLVYHCSLRHVQDSCEVHTSEGCFDLDSVPDDILAGHLAALRHHLERAQEQGKDCTVTVSNTPRTGPFHPLDIWPE